MGWVLLLGCCAGVVFATAYGFSPASAHEEWRLVDVPPKASLGEIADKLETMGLIRSKVCFLAAARISGDSSHLQAGQYSLSPSLTPGEIVSRLASGAVVNEWVVIPEGSTLRQIQRILARHKLARPDRFEQALRRRATSYRRVLHLPSPELEGFLFPDTYKIPRTMAEEDIVRMMVERFRQSVVEGLQSQREKSTNGLGLYQTIVLASLIETEAQRDSERAHIAGVLVNRLRSGMKLECDASIEYALPEHKSRLTHADLQIESPYNTYEHRGLPPTPVCSPGLPSVEAALAPAATHDFYYVATPGGGHIFSQTLADHDRAIQRVHQMQNEGGQAL